MKIITQPFDNMLPLEQYNHKESNKQKKQYIWVAYLKIIYVWHIFVTLSNVINKY